jgi:hypothetical protein
MKLRWIATPIFLTGIALAISVVNSDVIKAQQPQPSPPPPTAQPQPAGKPANIDRNGVLMLVRSSLLALDQANKTGNYTVLRDLGAPGFQAANSPARLGEIFAKLRNDKVDLSGVAVIDPQLLLLPQIESNGLMHMAGFFPSVPSQVNFELMFMPIDTQWRLFGISVNIGQSSPIAPQAPAPVASIKPPAHDGGTPAHNSKAKSTQPSKIDPENGR